MQSLQVRVLDLFLHYPVCYAVAEEVIQLTKYYAFCAI